MSDSGDEKTHAKTTELSDLTDRADDQVTGGSSPPPPTPGMTDVPGRPRYIIPCVTQR